MKYKVDDYIYTFHSRIELDSLIKLLNIDLGNYEKIYRDEEYIDWDEPISQEVGLQFQIRDEIDRYIKRTGRVSNTTRI